MLINNTKKKSNYAINLKLRRRAFTQGGSLPHKPEVTPNDGCGQCAALVKLPVQQHKSNYRQKEQQCGAPAAMTHSYALKFKIKDGGGGRVQTTEFYWLSSFSWTGAVASRLPLKATLNCKLPQTFWWKTFWTNLGTTATNRLTKKNRTLQQKKINLTLSAATTHHSCARQVNQQFKDLPLFGDFVIFFLFFFELHKWNWQTFHGIQQVVVVNTGGQLVQRVSPPDWSTSTHLLADWTSTPLARHSRALIGPFSSVTPSELQTGM